MSGRRAPAVWLCAALLAPALAAAPEPASVSWQTLGGDGEPVSYALGDYTSLYRVCECTRAVGALRVCRCTEPRGDVPPPPDAPMSPQVQRAGASR